MGAALALAVTAWSLILGIVMFRFGARSAGKVEIVKILRQHGLSPDAAKLFGRAIKLLRRLDATTDLDGAFAGDVLSPETKKQVSEWLADYRKGLDRL
jgi:hypothetical protein